MLHHRLLRFPLWHATDLKESMPILYQHFLNDSLVAFESCLHCNSAVVMNRASSQQSLPKIFGGDG